MKIKLENIGKIKSAEVELNGITVIAGENDTGKSTVGKALFCVTNEFYDLDTVTKIKEEKISIVFETLKSLHVLSPYIFTRFNDFVPLATDIIEKSETYLSDRLILSDLIREKVNEFGLDDFSRFPGKLENDEIERVVDKVTEILKITDDQFLKKLLQNKIDSQFYSQISRFGERNCGIELYFDRTPIKIEIVSNIIRSVKVSSDRLLIRACIYVSGSVYNFGIDSLNNNTIKKILIEEKLSKIMEKINLASPGDIVQDKFGTFVYKNPNSPSVNVNNLSMGIKSFSMIKTLLKNGFLSDGGFLILDEPEINLHPKWQLVYAEVLVLLQKTLDLRILLNTHSPYFLKAIEDYSEYHKINDRCKFYLASNEEDYSNIVDVTGDVEKIYNILAEPFQTLIDVRYADDVD